MHEQTVTASFRVPTAQDMRRLGVGVAELAKGGDVMLLSGPLGAGKTTFAQGFGAGLHIEEPIVSPTFTIARELDGRLPDGSDMHVVHVDAYRLGGKVYAPGQNSVDQLLDELESLGLDEVLESPSHNTVILMEWGEQMIAALAPERLEIHVDRPVCVPMGGKDAALDSQDGDGQVGLQDALTSEGERIVRCVGVGAAWTDRVRQLERWYAVQVVGVM